MARPLRQNRLRAEERHEALKKKFPTAAGLVALNRAHCAQNAIEAERGHGPFAPDDNEDVLRRPTGWQCEGEGYADVQTIDIVEALG